MNKGLTIEITTNRHELEQTKALTEYLSKLDPTPIIILKIPPEDEHFFRQEHQVYHNGVIYTNTVSFDITKSITVGLNGTNE